MNSGIKRTYEACSPPCGRLIAAGAGPYIIIFAGIENVSGIGSDAEQTLARVRL